MPLNNSYDEEAVIQAIASALETFYGTLIEKIDGLNIQKVMKRKNPYLYRAKAMQSATEIVDSVLVKKLFSVIVFLSQLLLLQVVETKLWQKALIL